MPTSVRLEGMEEFRRALRSLPEDLAREADAVIVAAAEELQRSAAQDYPQGPTGNLKRGVTSEHNRSKFGTGAIVRSRAKHAWMFEHGTKTRRTSKGANRGAMPKAPESERFIPKAIRIRARMTAALVEIVRKAGLQVDL